MLWTEESAGSAALPTDGSTVSAKYERLKKQDLLLPAPLRWLTRAFSSITLAVILLVLVVCYGTIASVPVGLLAHGALHGLAGLLIVLPAVWLAYRCGREHLTPLAGQPFWRRFAVAELLLLGAVVLLWLAVRQINAFVAGEPWFVEHRATVLYRLRFFEMTELEFYSWWPMKLILGLFVLNMIWATLRRIEFKFVNLGVLTVHTGIVVVAVGSILYGRNKLEGDTVLWRSDLGGKPVDEFYAGTTPAVYLTLGRKNVMLALPDLPRYNDYDDDPTTALPALDIRLHDTEAFKQVFGDQLKATIRAFIAYGEFEPQWVDAAERDDMPHSLPNPALRIGLGDEQAPLFAIDQVLLAAIPAQRVVDQRDWAIEFLYRPGEKRLHDLTARFPGPHGLVVEIPAANYREVFGVTKGQQIKLGDTGYELTIEDLGPYGLSFATEGYQGATDTRATVQVRQGERVFRRMAMHRYPERSQDFVPDPGNPNVGPMGRRTDPARDIVLTYLDATRPQFRLIAQEPDLQQLLLIARLPGQDPLSGILPADRFPIGSDGTQQFFLHITQRLTSAARVFEPRITPKPQRQPKDEGTYLHALLPVDLEATLPDGTPWQRRIWLGHMRYPLPEYGDQFHRPIDVLAPHLGKITLAFSRQRLALPFSLQLEEFAMTPYPGSTIPRDFQSTLLITERDGSTSTGITRLNNPLIHHGFKLSQTGWDPGNPRSPQNDAKNEAGRFINQQRFSILGVGNNVGIRIIFIGSCLIVIGIPWAFYLKPLLLRRRKQAIQRELAAQTASEAVS